MANKTGKGGFAENPQNRNPHGTPPSPAVIAFHRTLRETVANIGNELVKVKENDESEEKEFPRIEIAVRGLYARAAAGDVQAFNALVERVEGKVPSGDDFTLQERLNKLVNEFLLKLAPIYGEQRAREIVGHLANVNGLDSGSSSAESEPA